MARRLIRFSMLIVIAACPAWSGSIYTTVSAWQASSPGSTAVLDFESFSPAFYSSFSSSPYSFTASGGLYVQGGAAAGTGSGHFLTTTGAQVLNIDLTTGVYGVAFNLGSNSGTASIASILAIDTNGLQYLTNNFTTASPSSPAMFWGLRNDVQLVSVKVTFASGINPQLDNVRYSNTTLPSQGPVNPEPETWLLVATGGVVLLFRHGSTSKSSKCGVHASGFAGLLSHRRSRDAR